MKLHRGTSPALTAIKHVETGVVRTIMCASPAAVARALASLPAGAYVAHHVLPSQHVEVGDRLVPLGNTTQVVKDETGQRHVEAPLSVVKATHELHAKERIELRSARSVLLVRSRGLGDVIFALTAGYALKQQKPTMRVGLMTDRAYVALAKWYPWLDAAVEHVKDGDWEIRVDLQKAFDVTSRRDRAQLMGEALGVYAQTMPRITVPPEMQESIRKEYVDQPHPWIAFAPYSSGWSKTRSLPVDVAGQLLELLSKREGTVFLMDRLYINHLPRTANCINVSQRLPLLDATALVSLCDGFVGTDSGMLWVAATCGVPAVATFTHIHPDARWQTANNMTALWADMPCSPCGDFANDPPCHNADRHLCARLFTAEQILKELDGRLGQTTGKQLVVVHAGPQNQGATAAAAHLRPRTTTLLAVAPRLSGGGGERHLATLLHGLSAHYECHVVVQNQSGDQHLLTEFGSFYRGTLDGCTRDERRTQLGWFVKGLQPDRILFYHNGLAVEASQQCRLFTGRIVGIIHTLFDHEVAIVAQHHGAVSTFVCASEAVKRNLWEKTAAPNLTVIRHGVDADAIATAVSLRDQLGFTPDHYVVGYLGRIAAGKGIMSLLEAFLALAHEDPAYRLLLIGWGEEVSACRRYVDHNDLTGRVVLRGFESDIGPFLKSMDCFVLASAAEGGAVPYSAMEAIAADVPIVITDVGDVGALLQDGAVILPDAGPKSIAEAVRKLRADPMLVAGMTTAARAVLDAELSAQGMIEKYLEVLL